MKKVSDRKHKTSKIRVGVLRGGPSEEYEVSLETGGAILEHLPKKYHPVDIFIDKNNKWHIDGMVCRPEKAINRVDVIFNGLHGSYGEDGKVQRILEHFKIPYTGSGPLSSALSMNKLLSKKIFEEKGIKVPRFKSLKKQDLNYLKSFEIFSEMRKPLIVKPSNSGSSLGVSITQSIEQFSEALRQAFKYSDTAIVEEFVNGREVTCAVIQGHDTDYTLPIVEIKVSNNSSIFGYDEKYSDETKKICPTDFHQKIEEKIHKTALMAHQALKLRHYSRTDMIVSDDGQIYVLETNSLPGLTPESLLPKSLKAHGLDLADFLDHVLQTALSGR